jgi:hypothetical protein
MGARAQMAALSPNLIRQKTGFKLFFMQNNKVFVIKFVHSVIFLFMVACLFYILYCAIARRYDWTLLAALILAFIEGAALVLNRGRCPLTSLAEKYGAVDGSVTGIFLPGWLARYTFKISMVLVAVEIIWLAWGYFTR